LLGTIKAPTLNITEVSVMEDTGYNGRAPINGVWMCQLLGCTV